jgi:hypothetical protein
MALEPAAVTTVARADVEQAVGAERMANISVADAHAQDGQGQPQVTSAPDPAAATTGSSATTAPKVCLKFDKPFQNSC